MRGRLIAGILIILVGAVWIGQAVGLMRGSSFMVDDVRWVLIGAGMVVLGAALMIWDRRSRA